MTYSEIIADNLSKAVWRWACVSHLRAVAACPAIAFLVEVHWTVFAGFLANGLVRRKGYHANRCCQNRKENLRRVFHRY